MIYKRRGLDHLRDNDEIDNFEDGFMQGYLSAYKKNGRHREI